MSGVAETKEAVSVGMELLVVVFVPVAFVSVTFVSRCVAWGI